MAPHVPKSKRCDRAILEHRSMNQSTSSTYAVSAGYGTCAVRDGLTPGTISHFGLFKTELGDGRNQYTTPLHDPAGNPRGQMTYIVDRPGTDAIMAHPDSAGAPAVPPPKPQCDETAGTSLVYNAHRIRHPATHLIVVHDIPAVWWLWQHGYGNTVAVSQNSCTSREAETIISCVELEGRVWILCPGSSAGATFARTVRAAICQSRPTCWVRLGSTQSPFGLAPEVLAILLPFR